MLFVWDEECCVGIAEIDADHRVLVNLINDLYEAMQDGCGGAALMPIFSALKRYTESHFAREEKYMAEGGVPDQQKHLREHQLMRDTLADLQSRHRQGEAAISLQTLTFLRDWLKTHIRGVDRAMAPYLSDKGHV